MYARDGVVYLLLFALKRSLQIQGLSHFGCSESKRESHHDENINLQVIKMRV